MVFYLVIETQYTDDMGYVQPNITFEFNYLVLVILISIERTKMVLGGTRSILSHAERKTVIKLFYILSGSLEIA